MLPSVGLMFLLAAGKDFSGQNLGYFNGYDKNVPCCVLHCWNFQECNPTLNKDPLFVNVILFHVEYNTGISCFCI